MRSGRDIMIRTTLFLLSFLSCSILSAQIYPVQSDLQKEGLNGPVRTTITTSRTYQPGAERWEPLEIKVVSTYNREGELIEKKTYIAHRHSTAPLFTYDKDADSIRPVIDATSALTSDSAEKPRLINTEIRTYQPDGRIRSVLNRNYQMGKATMREYAYDGSVLDLILERDSATKGITMIEDFFYLPGNKPQGSTIRKFNPATDLVTALSDTSSVPQKRVSYDYTSYVYGDTITPVIYWKWEYGNDTTVDRQEIKRYLEDGTLSASIMQHFNNGKIVRARSQIFNEYGDAVSNADSFGNDTTLQRIFDYIYDELDPQGNWRIKRQYVKTDPERSDSEERALLGRSDRKIIYFEE